MTPKTSPRPLPLLGIIMLLVLAACSAKPSPTAVIEATPTLAPEAVVTPTPTPEPAVVWLITGTDVENPLSSEISAFMNERASIDGFTLEVLENFNQGAVPGDLQIAVLLSPQVDVSSLAANLPDTEFVVIADTDLAPAENLSVIYASQNQVVFLAGYLATLNAPDFRSGALLVDGAANTSQLQDSFLNGGRYFCGRCAPVFAPIVLFPQTGLVPAGANAAGWQAAFDALHQNDIELLYVPQEGLQPDFLAYLAGKNVGIISNAPPPAGSETIWVATVQSDSVAALASIWPALTSGEGGKALQSGLVLSNVNSANLSPGRQQLAERIIPDLVAGIISPLSVP